MASPFMYGWEWRPNAGIRPGTGSRQGGGGLSPSAQELQHQIALARQLMQKQQQAEVRAATRFGRRPATARPSAHVSPIVKENKSSTHYEQKFRSLSDNESSLDDDEDVKSGKLSPNKLRLSLHSPPFTARSSHLSGSLVTKTPEIPSVNSSRRTGEELVGKWRAQSEARQLETRLREKTKEVADLQTKIDQTLRLAQEKERRLVGMEAYLEETAVKQTAAKQQLKRYVDDLANRAEKAENEVENLRSSASLSRTESLSRSIEGMESSALSPGYAHNYSPQFESRPPLHVNKGTNSVVQPSPIHNAYSPGLSRSNERKKPEIDSKYFSVGNPNSRNNTDGVRTFPDNSHDYFLPSTRESTSIPHSQRSLGNASESFSPEPLINRDDVKVTNQAPLMRSNDDYMKPSSYLERDIDISPSLAYTEYSPSLLPPMSSHLPASLPRDTTVGRGWMLENDWSNLDFLEEVMEDVLAQRREREQDAHQHDHHPKGGCGLRDDDEGSSSDVSVTTVSQWSETGHGRREDGRGSLEGLGVVRRRAVLLLVFSYLSVPILLRCGAVSREWREVSRLPELWQYVRLNDRKITAKFLKTISSWCTQTRWLILERLSVGKQRSGEDAESFHKRIRGSLEPGLEEILQSAGNELLTFKVVDCPYIITERALWLVSCHSRSLQSLTYVTKTDPVGSEVLWALGAGCRHIRSLKIPPRHPCERPKRFSSSCITMIGRCWTQLQALSVGGCHAKPESLETVIRSCAKLQVLELDHMIKITEDKATRLCCSGLRGLHTLILKHTPISPSAILHFNGACPLLTRISIHLSLSDFFPLPASPGQKKEFSRAIESLLELSKRRSLENTLQVRANYK